MSEEQKENEFEKAKNNFLKFNKNYYEVKKNRRGGSFINNL